MAQYNINPPDYPRETGVGTPQGLAFPGLAGVLPGFGRFEPNDWGLGFELRDDKRPHWTGTGNSPRTFGHFGAAGTFLWVDPDAGLACVCRRRPRRTRRGSRSRPPARSAGRRMPTSSVSPSRPCRRDVGATAASARPRS